MKRDSLGRSLARRARRAVAALRRAATSRRPPPSQPGRSRRRARCGSRRSRCTTRRSRSQPVAEQDVDDTIVTSGTVTFDDLRVAHVFSPVTGRVAQIAAQLGQRVKKGDAARGHRVARHRQRRPPTSHKAQADLIAAEHDYKRQKELFERTPARSRTSRRPRTTTARRRPSWSARGRRRACSAPASVDAVTQTYTLPRPSTAR